MICWFRGAAEKPAAWLSSWRKHLQSSLSGTETAAKVQKELFSFIQQNYMTKLQIDTLQYIIFFFASYIHFIIDFFGLFISEHFQFSVSMLVHFICL